MDNKIAKFDPRESNKIAANRKEHAGLYRGYALIDLDAGTTAATLRIYWPGSVAYACVWIKASGTYARGAGRAGGGGYCKASAAAGAALDDAGVKLEHDIAGRGLEAITRALLALAKWMDIPRPLVHVAHA